MTRRTGISDRFRVSNAAGDITSTLGRGGTATFTLDENTQTGEDINTGSQYGYHYDNTSQHTCTLTVRSSDFRPLQLLGTDDDAGSITLDDTLPEHTVKIQDTDTKTVELSGVKFGRVRISFRRDEELEFEFEGRAKAYTDVSETLSTLDVDVQPAQWFELDVAIDETSIGGAAGLEVTYDRGVEGVTDVAEGSNDVSLIYEGYRDITGTLSVDTDEGVTLDTYRNKDVVDVTVELTDSSSGIVLRDTRLTSYAGGAEGNDDLRVHDFDIQSLNIDTVTY